MFIYGMAGDWPTPDELFAMFETAFLEACGSLGGATLAAVKEKRFKCI